MALEAGRMGTWDWDIPGRRISWSPTLERLHGLEPGSFGGTFDDYQADMHPEDRERVLAAIQEAVSRRRNYAVEYRIVRPDGAVRWLEARGRLFLDDDGEPVKMAGVCSDVTERKRGEEVLRFTAEVSRVLGSSLDFDTTLASVAQLTVPFLADWCVLDLLEPDGSIRRVATAHADPEKRRWAREVSERYPPQRTSSGVGRVLDGGEPLVVPDIDSGQLALLARDEEHLRILRELGPRSALVVPLEARGEIFGAVSLVSTESGRRYTEEDLPLALDVAHQAAMAVDNARLFSRAREAVVARDRLLAVVSHDLRDPLNSIVLSTRLLEEDALDPELRMRSAASMRRAAERANRLIGDLLDAAQIESGNLAVEREPIEAAALVDEAALAFREAAAESSVELRAEVAGPLGLVSGDRDRIGQVFSNLLRNALKAASPGGRITVSARPAGDDVRFSVADTGAGIEPDELPHLFESFWQGRKELRGGVGLGLGIARGIVEAHGGRIWAESEPGGGSAFHFTLPAVPPPRERDR